MEILNNLQIDNAIREFEDNFAKINELKTKLKSIKDFDSFNRQKENIMQFFTNYEKNLINLLNTIKDFQYQKRKIYDKIAYLENKEKTSIEKSYSFYKDNQMLLGIISKQEGEINYLNKVITNQENFINRINAGDLEEYGYTATPQDLAKNEEKFGMESLKVSEIKDKHIKISDLRDDKISKSDLETSDKKLKMDMNNNFETTPDKVREKGIINYEQYYANKEKEKSTTNKKDYNKIIENYENYKKSKNKNNLKNLSGTYSNVYNNNNYNISTNLNPTEPVSELYSKSQKASELYRNENYSSILDKLDTEKNLTKNEENDKKSISNGAPTTQQYVFEDSNKKSNITESLESSYKLKASESDGFKELLVKEEKKVKMQRVSDLIIKIVADNELLTYLKKIYGDKIQQKILDENVKIEFLDEVNESIKLFEDTKKKSVLNSNDDFSTGHFNSNISSGLQTLKENNVNCSNTRPYSSHSFNKSFNKSFIKGFADEKNNNCLLKNYFLLNLQREKLIEQKNKKKK